MSKIESKVANICKWCDEEWLATQKTHECLGLIRNLCVSRFHGDQTHSGSQLLLIQQTVSVGFLGMEPFPLDSKHRWYPALPSRRTWTWHFWVSQIIAPPTNGGCKIPNCAWVVHSPPHIYVCRKRVHLKSAEGDSLPISPGANDFSEPDSRISQIRAHAQVLSRGGWSTLWMISIKMFHSYCFHVCQMRWEVTHYKLCFFGEHSPCLHDCLPNHRASSNNGIAVPGASIKNNQQNNGQTMPDPGWCFMC